MKIIKCLSELITEELKDADKYIDLAEKWKSDEPDTADLFYQLSTEEMGHVDKLHEEVKALKGFRMLIRCRSSQVRASLRSQEV